MRNRSREKLGGDIFWAYCNGIILGVKHYYRENMQKTCPFRGYVYDETALNRVKEAYNLIKDILVSAIFFALFRLLYRKFHGYLHK